VTTPPLEIAYTTKEFCKILLVSVIQNSIILFIIGTVIGSFLNVLIYRIPIGKDFISGRSSCPKCYKVIPWYGLFPVFSYVFQRGKCLFCKEKISIQYPVIETISGLIFVGTSMFLYSPFLSIPDLTYWLFYIAIIEITLLLFVIDLKHFILPDSLVLSLLVAFGAYYLTTQILGISPDYVQSSLTIQNRLLGSLVIGGALFLLWFLSKGRALGFGDVKLMSVLGIIFGLKGGIIIFYMAMFIGLIVGLFLIFFKQADLKTKVPFGTFIGLSVLTYIFFYNQIISYVNFLILRAFTTV